MYIYIYVYMYRQFYIDIYIYTYIGTCNTSIDSLPNFIEISSYTEKLKESYSKQSYTQHLRF